MKGLGFSSLLVAVTLVLMLINGVLMAYVMYTMANSKGFEWDTNNDKLATKKGDEATKLWKDKKYFVIAPTVCNVLGMVILGLLYVMG